MYTTKGAKQKSGGVTYRTALDYVELQPNIIYKKTVKNNAFFALVGAYYAPFAFGTYKASKKVLGPKGDSKTQTINMGRGKDDEMKSTDFGLNLAVGIDMKNNGRFGIQYELGLMNISNAEEGSAKNGSFSIFFTTPLNFGKKKNS